MANGSEIQFGLKYFAFQGAPNTLLEFTLLRRQVPPPYQQLVRYTMRLYKQKDIPKPHRNTLDSPPGLPPTSPGSTTPDRFKRAAEAVSKQISGHKAMVSQFKEMRLPRPSMFSTKSATSDGSQTIPIPFHLRKARPPSDLGSLRPSRGVASNSNASDFRCQPQATTRSFQRGHELAVPPQATRPRLEKATRPVSKPFRSPCYWKTPRSVQSPIRSSLQKTGAKPSTSPSNDRASTGADLTSVSVASVPTQADVDEPILFVSCFHSLDEDDPEMEDELSETVEVTSDLESQVAQIFGVGLGYVSEDEVVKHGEIAPPKVTPEAVLAPTLESMSAVVEWWEPTVNPAIESDVATAMKSKGQTDGFETISLDQNQISCTLSTDIGMPSLSLSRQPSQPTSCSQIRRMALPRTCSTSVLLISRFPEFVASLCLAPVSLYRSGAFASRALRHCAGQDHLKCRSSVLTRESSHEILAEQRHHARGISPSIPVRLVGLLPWRSWSLLSSL